MTKGRPDTWLARRGGSVELLRVPAALFGFLTGVRTRLYDRGLLPRVRLDVPVVSIGNLTAGGTGKTPLVAWTVRALRELGRRPGVLSRGYGKERGAESNDEARMLARVLGDVPHVQNPDRVEGGRTLIEQGVDVVVLDDGFQHRRLARDLDLVLVDATRPWGLPVSGDSAPPLDAVRALIPRGLLREKPSALARADAIVITRSDQVAQAELERLRQALLDLAPGPALALGEHRPLRIAAPDGSFHTPAGLRGRSVHLISGIGNPEAFERTVRSLGAEVQSHRAFPDHHLYRPDELEGLPFGTAVDERDAWVVTTAKDAPKLESVGLRAHVLEVEFELREGAPVLAALLESLRLGGSGRRRAALHEGLHG